MPKALHLRSVTDHHRAAFGAANLTVHPLGAGAAALRTPLDSFDPFDPALAPIFGTPFDALDPARTAIFVPLSTLLLAYAALGSALLALLAALGMIATAIAMLARLAAATAGMIAAAAMLTAATASTTL